MAAEPPYKSRSLDLAGQSAIKQTWASLGPEDVTPLPGLSACGANWQKVHKHYELRLCPLTEFVGGRVPVLAGGFHFFAASLYWFTYEFWWSYLKFCGRILVSCCLDSEGNNSINFFLLRCWQSTSNPNKSNCRVTKWVKSPSMLLVQCFPFLPVGHPRLHRFRRVFDGFSKLFFKQSRWGSLERGSFFQLLINIMVDMC